MTNDNNRNIKDEFLSSIISVCLGPNSPKPVVAINRKLLCKVNFYFTNIDSLNGQMQFSVHLLFWYISRNWRIETFFGGVYCETSNFYPFNWLGNINVLGRYSWESILSFKINNRTFGGIFLEILDFEIRRFCKNVKFWHASHSKNRFSRKSVANMI